jgi:hypothetical protein
LNPWTLEPFAFLNYLQPPDFRYQAFDLILRLPLDHLSLVPEFRGKDLPDLGG